MRSIGKNSARSGLKRNPKLPDELHPIVDAVVEVVFERLRSAATNKSAGKVPPARRKMAKLNLPLPKQRKALAEALADLLLADLAGRARSRPRAGKKSAGRPGERGTATPQGRARLK